MKAPIIFIHYNDSKYLKYTLRAAIHSNPAKDIILIGDQTNQHYEKDGIKHVFFEDYLIDSKIEHFFTVFKYIVGREFSNSTYGEKWTRFNFLKWFVLSNYLRTNKIESFWVFDSDVMIVDDLEKFELSFSRFDYTTCSGELFQLFGFVKESETIDSFADSINDMFIDDQFIEEQRIIMDNNPQWGLTMMRAFQRFKLLNNKSVINIFNKTEIYNGYLFLDFNRHLDDLPNNVSKAKNGFVNLFFQDSKVYIQIGEEYINVPLLNMSWMPEYLMERVYRLYLNSESLTSLNFKVPIFNVIGDYIRRVKRNLVSFYNN